MFQKYNLLGEMWLAHQKDKVFLLTFFPLKIIRKKKRTIGVPVNKQILMKKK